MRVYDASGRLAATRRVSGTGKLRLGLPSGAYVVEIESAGAKRRKAAVVR